MRVPGLDMSVHTDTLVEALGPDSGAVRVDYHSGSVSAHLIADAVFFAVGWPANLGHLALTAAGVHATPAAIPVDDYLRTNVEHIFTEAVCMAAQKICRTLGVGSFPRCGAISDLKTDPRPAHRK